MSKVNVQIFLLEFVASCYLFSCHVETIFERNEILVVTTSKYNICYILGLNVQMRIRTPVIWWLWRLWENRNIIGIFYSTPELHFSGSLYFIIPISNGT